MCVNVCVGACLHVCVGACMHVCGGASEYVHVCKKESMRDAPDQIYN